MRDRLRERAAGVLVAIVALAALVFGVGSSGTSLGDRTGAPTLGSADASILASLGLAVVGPASPADVDASAGTAGGSGAPTAAPTTRPGTAATKPPTPGPAGATTPRPTPRPTPKPTPKPVPPPPLSHCPIFPASNAWNEKVSGLPVAADSDAMIAAIGLGAHLHPDFSNGGGYGIPYNLVSSSTPRSTVTFQYASESDKVGYPIPANVKIEGGSDRHILMIDTSACKLYELFAARKVSGVWHAGSGAVWNLRSNALRPAGWTSADAAGLPIFPGLVRYDEVASGVIRHALRFTASATCAGYIYPARHEAGSGSCSSLPPMGLRVRLKASVDISGYGTQARVVLQALKDYGMILADNGSPWYVTGAPSSGWNDDVLHKLNQIPGSDFEVVDTGS